MKKIILFLAFFVAVLVLGSSLVWAKEDTAKDDKGPLTKITFIHYKKEPVKPSGPALNRTTQCYGFLAKGAKWKTTEDYLVNPTNSKLDSTFVVQGLGNGVTEWEKYGGSRIFGSGSLNTTAPYDPNHMDNKNVVVFGPYPDNRVIAVTTVWGYFSGPVSTRQLVEWDMLFNAAFKWGDATVDLTKMDLQNIATHELGHSAGMDDLYNTVCSLETMYGYSSEGETIKRYLNSGDITGIQQLYR